MRCVRERPRRSRRHTTRVSPSRRCEKASAKPGRSAVPPLTVSVKVLVQPAFWRASSWRSSVWSVVETLAYPMSICLLVYGLEDCQLPLLLLLPAFEVQSQNRLIHHPGKREDLIDLFFFGNPPQLVLEGNGDLGFEETLLLFGGYCHKEIVSKPVSHVNK